MFEVFLLFFLKKKSIKMKKRTKEWDKDEGLVVYQGNAFDCV